MTTAKPILHGIMPNMLAHEGIWEGVYRHVDLAGDTIDIHHVRVECVFPSKGPFAYIQKNLFSWPDGTEKHAVLEGELRREESGDRLWFDHETFSGISWETEKGLILLDLDRKDDPRANFYEIICMGSSGRDRARTWHWFKDGALFKRTLCDERRVA